MQAAVTYGEPPDPVEGRLVDLEDQPPGWVRIPISIDAMLTEEILERARHHAAQKDAGDRARHQSSSWSPHSQVAAPTQGILMTERILEIRYRNLLEQQIIVLVEPWAERFKVAGGACFKFRVLSQEPGSPLTKLLPGGLIFEFWKGVTLDMFIDDQPGDAPSLKIPAPF